MFIQILEEKRIPNSDESFWLVNFLPLIHSVVQAQRMIHPIFWPTLLTSINPNKDYSLKVVSGNLSGNCRISQVDKLSGEFMIFFFLIEIVMWHAECPVGMTTYFMIQIKHFLPSMAFIRIFWHMVPKVTETLEIWNKIHCTWDGACLELSTTYKTFQENIMFYFFVMYNLVDDFVHGRENSFKGCLKTSYFCKESIL